MHARPQGDGYYLVVSGPDDNIYRFNNDGTEVFSVPLPVGPGITLLIGNLYWSGIDDVGDLIILSWVDPVDPTVVTSGLVTKLSGTNGSVIVIDLDVLKELVDRRSQLGQRPHCAGKVLDVDCRLGIEPDLGDGGFQGALRRLTQKLAIRRPVIGCAVFLFLNRQDISCSLSSGQQVLAIFGCKKIAQRFNTPDDQRDIILPAKRKDRVDQIVPHAFITQVHLEAIGEEGEQVLVQL